MAVIPFLNIDLSETREKLRNKLQEERNMRRCVLITVCIALLLDNMIYMVIVPIIPVYLNEINAWDHPDCAEQRADVPFGNLTKPFTCKQLQMLAKDNDTMKSHFHSLFPLMTFHGDRDDAKIGVLFASKAIVQLFVNPISGMAIDKYGYETPMLIGLSILFASTSLFAMGTSYGVLFFARSLQGVGSAFADTSGLAMIADTYSEENGRQSAMAIAIAFISFGCLFAPPFGGLLYELAGKSLPFIILALIALIDGVLMYFITYERRKKRSEAKASGEAPKGRPIYKLIMDPYIALCAGALVMANSSLAFLEPTIAIWMKQTMNATEFQIGVVWLPAFFPHVLGVLVTVKLCKIFPSRQWLITAVGLALEGVGCLVAPFCTTYSAVIVPLFIICFGIALVDTAVLPTLAYLVDKRHTSVYGSVYAIADISYSLAYAVGPIVAGGLIGSIGFLWLNIILFVTNVGYSPLMALLRNVYKYKPFSNDDDDGEEETYLYDDKDKKKTYMLDNLNGTIIGANPDKQPMNGHAAVVGGDGASDKPGNPYYVTENDEQPRRISYKRQSVDSDLDCGYNQ